MDHHPIEQAEDGIIQIEDDVDSSYGDYSDVASGTTSLYSQITSHVYENGRRYNGWRYGTYWYVARLVSVKGLKAEHSRGPNDEQASDNLDLFHHVFNLTFGGRTFLAPIGDNPQRVLDLAEISVVAQSDDSSLKGTAIERWGPLAHKVGDVFGKSFRIVDEMTDMIKSAGFVNVKKRTFKWPIGTWPKDPKLKEIGLYNKLGWEEGLDGWANFLFTNYLGWTLEEVQVLTAHIRNDLRNPKVHAWQHVTVCYGQKPTAKKVKD
ncbi:UMTA protein [Coccidioides immitis RMSCC 3703]|uniref:UMTA protein n=1 Tax=Coccidioides immitis RMSCC 3703 TaxID=454286 RepID=A0A0J8QQ26_COCIT|nr:UMTA protein [Coccidioides immitis RMSCC 3703]